MTSKDFELIANSISNAVVCDRGGGNREGIEVAAYAISDALLDTNPRFDQVRFLTACGVLT